MCDTLIPVNVENWIAENKNAFLPPVCNMLMWVFTFTLLQATLLCACFCSETVKLQLDKNTSEKKVLLLTVTFTVRLQTNVRRQTVTTWLFFLLSFRHFCQLNIMFVGGPNTRKDYHIEEGEEVKEKQWFDQCQVSVPPLTFNFALNCLIQNEFANLNYKNTHNFGIASAVILTFSFDVIIHIV